MFFDKTNCAMWRVTCDERRRRNSRKSGRIQPNPAKTNRQMPRNAALCRLVPHKKIYFFTLGSRFAPLRESDQIQPNQTLSESSVPVFFGFFRFFPLFYEGGGVVKSPKSKLQGPKFSVLRSGGRNGQDYRIIMMVTSQLETE